MNLWHDISAGSNIPQELNVVIEIPKGSSNKYEIDKETGLIALDRANYSSAPYPFEYGFVPKTLWHDGDALDVVLLTTFPIMPGILVHVRPVALLEMIDSGENDYKIIGVPINDKRWEETQDLSDINQHTLKEISHFFETYKELKGKGDVIEAKSYKGKKEALEAILKSIEMYKKKFDK